MNIQIFGKTKCFETKKAERYFKERSIKYQLIDLTLKGMSRGEADSIGRALGGYEHLLNDKAKDRDLVALITYLSPEDRLAKMLENPQVLKTPVVRNGKLATIGFRPDIWKNWE